MTPLAYYQQQQNQGLIHSDPQQMEALQELQRIHLECLKRQKRSAFRRWIPHKPVKGLYLWGHIGAGKTYLIDIFYHGVSVKKWRLHFHQFMQYIHDELTRLRGQPNPLEQVAQHIAKRAQVLCLDELLVTNVVDAMILHQLLKALFKQNICLVTSANLPPDELYKEGLQRESFLPAIDIIKQHTVVFHLLSNHDYRLGHPSQIGFYFSPLNEIAEINMEKSFQRFSYNQPANHEPLHLFNRPIQIRRKTEDVIWFDFMDLCGIPRSQKDYLALIEKYHTVLISNVPIFESDQHNLITAFINLIDVFYDARIRVIISATTDIALLYPGGQHQFEFARTRSRLTEMQSINYCPRSSVLSSR